MFDHRLPFFQAIIFNHLFFLQSAGAGSPIASASGETKLIIFSLNHAITALSSEYAAFLFNGWKHPFGAAYCDWAGNLVITAVNNVKDL
jgi:hypothetical protein